MNLNPTPTTKNANPLSLFHIVLDFVGRNAEIIESLVNFPEDIGKQIFEIFICLKKEKLGNNLSHLDTHEKDFLKSLNTFVTAYKDNILKTLNLSHNLIMINEYLNTLMILIPFIKELCLCNCFLGNNHELISHLPNLTYLKKLCLRKNGLQSGVIRKISIPFRMFNRGPEGLEFIDLSNNPVTDEIVPWIVVFKNLKWLNLSNTNITTKGIKAFENKGFFQLCDSIDVIHPIFTSGWIENIIQNWKKEHERRLHSRLISFPSKSLSEKNKYTSGKLILQSSNHPDVLN